MKLLLDTHIWIWAVGAPEKLSREVRRRLADPKNELLLSPISVWETHHLIRRRKIRIDRPYPDWLNYALAKVAIKEAPFSFAVAAEAAGIQLPQADVGDTFLAATASVFGLTLVTSDLQLLKCSWLKTLAND